MQWRRAAAFAGVAALCKQAELRDHNAGPKATTSRWETAAAAAAAAAGGRPCHLSPRGSSSGRCAFSAGCDIFLGMVAAVVVVELWLLKLLMILLVLLLLLLLMLLLGPVVALPAWAQPPPPPCPPPSRCSSRWASSVHDAFSVGMFVLILSDCCTNCSYCNWPTRTVRRTRGRDSRRAFLAARGHGHILTNIS